MNNVSLRSVADIVTPKCGNQECKSVEKLKRCSACLTERYCSIECQRIDWSKHKKICQMLKNQPPRHISFVIGTDGSKTSLKIFTKK